MRVPRIYQDVHLNVGDTLSLDSHALKHLVHVLRLSAGHEIILFNGQGGEFRAVLTDANKKLVSAEILEKQDTERESDIHIHLAQCVSKGDRFETALQKSVELGVSEITPVFSQRSQLKLNHERKQKKLQHWQQIIVSACEQSGRNRLPVFNQALELPEFLENAGANQNAKLMFHPEAKQKISGLEKHGAYTLLVGPEGGFEETELALAEKRGFQKVLLGKAILRTETAPIAAISALNMLEGEF